MHDRAANLTSSTRNCNFAVCHNRSCARMDAITVFNLML